MLKRFFRFVGISVLLLMAGIIKSDFVQASQDELDFNQQTITIHLKEKQPSISTSENGNYPSTGEKVGRSILFSGVFLVIGVFLLFVYQSKRRRYSNEK